MKKTKNVVVLVVLALALVTFCACGLLANATGIEITSYPKTSYTTADTDFDWTGFKLKITYSGAKEPETLTYEELKEKAGKSFNVSDFNRSVGTHTATITYQKLEVTFQYTVAAGTFAGGEGTKANPYQISTVEQLKRMWGTNYSDVTYFVLVNDIDASSYGDPISGGNNTSFDGANYSIKNITQTILNKLGTDGYVGIKNVSFYASSQEEMIWHIYADVVEFSNIKVYGTFGINAKDKINTGVNAGILVSQINKMNEVRFTNIDIYADLITESPYCSPFVGGWIKGTQGINSKAYFTKCNFYGYAQGMTVGFLAGNANAGACEYILEDCNNYGTIKAAFVGFNGIGRYVAGSEKTTNQTLGYAVTDTKNGLNAECNSDKIEAAVYNKAAEVCDSLGVTYDIAEDGTITFTGLKESVKYELQVRHWGKVSGGGTNEVVLGKCDVTSEGCSIKWKNWTAQEATDAGLIEITEELTPGTDRAKNAKYILVANSPEGRLLGALILSK